MVMSIIEQMTGERENRFKEACCDVRAFKIQGCRPKSISVRRERGKNVVARINKFFFLEFGQLLMANQKSNLSDFHFPVLHLFHLCPEK